MVVALALGGFGAGSRLWDLRFVCGHLLCDLRFMVVGLGLGVRGVGSRVWGLEFRVSG